jgi:tight adherence protein C
MEIAILLIFASVVAVTFAVGSLGSSNPAQKRLVKLRAGPAAEDATATATRRSKTSLVAETKSRLVRVLTPLAAAAPRHGEPSERLVRDRLIHAGYRSRSAPAVYFGSRVALALLVPITVLISQVFLDRSETQLMGFLIAAAGVGYIAPSSWLDRRVKKRQRSILHGLPDALDLMVVCVEAGLGINAALARVAREFSRTNPILNSELELVTLEIRAGKSLTQALRSLSDRTGLSEVSALVAMLVQTEQFGTSVANALRVHAQGVRVERMQAAEELAAKAPVKMLFPTLLIFAATLIVILGPGFIQLIAVFNNG